VFFVDKQKEFPANRYISSYYREDNFCEIIRQSEIFYNSQICLAEFDESIGNDLKDCILNGTIFYLHTFTNVVHI
jgi:intein-encoded DNA endonuclease-like protein